MQNEFIIIFRKKLKYFNSIENVFDTLIPFLNVTKYELPFQSIGFIPRLKNILYLKRFDSKVIHITGHDHYLLWWPFRNTILTIHDIEALRRKRGFKRWIFKKLWFDWPIKNARVVTTISEFSKSELIKLNNYKTEIKVIYNPLTMPLNYSPKKFNDDCPRILHIGMKENKNWRRLILALKGIKCELVIIGVPNEDALVLLKENHIKYQFKSNLSNEDVEKEYIVSDMLAFVSTYEGFGLPIIEAQAIGRVILSSNVTSIPEVAGKGALLVDPYSIDSIRDGVIKLIKNKKFREELIAEGLNNCKRFEVERIAFQYKDLYARL